MRLLSLRNSEEKYQQFGEFCIFNDPRYKTAVIPNNMIYRTNDVLELLNENLKRGEIKEAIEIFLEALPKDSKYDLYRNSAIQLLSQINVLEMEYSLHIRTERIDINKVTNGFQYLLNQVKKEFGRNIVLKQTRIFKQNLTPIGQGRKYDENTNVSFLNELIFLIKRFRKAAFIGIILLIITMFIFSAIEKDPSPIYQQKFIDTSVDKGSSKYFWSIFLTNYNNLEDAQRIQEAFGARGIKILKTTDDNFELHIFADNIEDAKDKHSNKVKKEWPSSRIKKIADCDLYNVTEKGFYICY